MRSRKLVMDACSQFDSIHQVASALTSGRTGSGAA
jgi:hypothetical protein